MNIKKIQATLLSVVIAIVCFTLFLNRGLSHTAQPAEFTCLANDQGRFIQSPPQYQNIYGIGLAYAEHINETASDFDPASMPPVFRKSNASLLPGTGVVAVPDHAALSEALNTLEPGLPGVLKEREIKLNALLDHEAELAFVLLEDVSYDALESADFKPKLGFFVANDLSARSIAILGEGQTDKYDYWGLSKSFDGFTPISERVWVPNEYHSAAIPCVKLQTRVNGELRQDQSTANLIYTPEDMLRFINAKYPSTPLKKGDIVLTGTPGGVILNVPRWKARLANLLDFDRYTKLSVSQKKDSAKKFLQPGNQVQVSAQWLGSVTIELEE